jgi:hypothetical protein
MQFAGEISENRICECSEFVGVRKAANLLKLIYEASSSISNADLVDKLIHM